jgi:hypothetical protein
MSDAIRATRPPRTLVQRFWEKVHRDGECWVWTGAIATSSRGGQQYGQFWDGTQRPSGSYRTVYAHRMSYELAVGPIPDGMQLDHLCHNGLCVRPSHLRVVTNKQNQEHLRGAHPTNKSGARGVCWHPQIRRWQVRVGHNGTQIYGGVYTDLAEAAAVATRIRNELFTHNDHDRRRDA